MFVYSECIHIVEIDESKFIGVSKHNRGRVAVNYVIGWVFGLYERGTKNVVLIVVLLIKQN